MTQLLLGTHRPTWLANPHADALRPLFLSRNVFADASGTCLRRTLPVARGPWALDSGSFTELQHHGDWRISAEQYAAQVVRLRDEVGHLRWAAPRDRMCEPIVIQGGWAGRQFFVGTHLSVPEHQRLTVLDFVELRQLLGPLVIPVLQGYTLADYQRCRDLYDRHGVDLAAEPLVGVGSVCRRQATGEIAALMAVLAGEGLRLHGFGVKAGGLDRYAGDLWSCDSMAWSKDGRHTRGCGCPCHRPHKTEANCIHHATRWHRQTMARLGAVQLALPVGVA